MVTGFILGVDPFYASSLGRLDPQGQDEAQGMCEKMALMLQKSAIVEVPPDTLGVYSNVFPVHKG